MAATKTITARFTAIDDMSGPIRQMTAGITAMVAAVEGMSQRMEAMASAMGADLSGLSSQSELMSQAVQRVNQAANALSEGQSRVSEACNMTREQMISMTEAAYQAAGASTEVMEAAISLADSTADLTDSMQSAQETQEELTAALEDAQSVMDELNDAENASAETRERLAEAMEEAQRAQEELTAAQEEAAAAQREALEIMQSGTATLQEIEAASERVAEAQERLSEAEDAAARATEELQDATDEARNGMEEFGESTSRAVQFLSNFQALEQFTQYLEELYDALMECVDASAQFGEALAKLSTIADSSKASMGQMRDDIVALSRETGTSVNELTEATYQAISASVDTASAVDFTATATRLATAGFTSSATAVDVLTTALNAYGLEASATESIADKLITTQNLGKVSVGELASSMGKVIPTAAASNVSIDNLCAGYVEMTKRGIAAAESTTYMNSMLNELVKSGSEVSDILMQQTGQSFSQLMADGASLGDVMQILGDAVNNDKDAFQNLWGSQEAGKAALTLYAATAEGFNATLAEMGSCAGATATAFETMENTTADALEDMSNSFDLLKISIGDAFAPVVEVVAGVITNVVSAVSEWIDQNQALVAGILTAVGVFGTIVAVLAAVGTVVSVVTTAFGALGASVTAALGPIGWIAAAIGVVVGVVTACSGALDEQTQKYNEASAVSKDYADTLNELESEYDALTESVGEEAAAQSELAANVEMARAEYEIMYQTMDEFTAEVDASCEAVDKLSDSVREQALELQKAPAVADAYMERISALAQRTNRTAGETRLMEGLLKNLNNTYPGLNANVEDFADASGAAASSIRRQIDAMNNTAAIEKYTAMLDEAIAAQQDLAIEQELAAAQLESAQQRYNNANLFEQWGWWGSVKSDLDAATEAVEKCDTAMQQSETTISFLEGKVQELGNAYGDVGDSAESAWNAMTADQQGDVIAAATFDAVRGELDEICQAWDEAAEAAAESLLQQGNAFEALQAKSEVSLAQAVSNMQKSAETMRSYAANLQTVNDALVESGRYTSEQVGQIMSQINSGAPEAIALTSEMASAAESGADSLYAFGDAAVELNAAAGEAGHTIAGVEQQVGEALANVQQMGTEIIASLDGVSAEAQTKATEAFTGYVQAIADSQGSAVDAANAVGTAAGEAAAQSLAASGEEAVNVMNDICGRIMAAANSCHPVIKVTADTSAAEAAIKRIQGMSTVGVKAKEADAQGTRFSADVFLAGEEGPELVVGARGSRVYTARETQEIMESLRDVQDTSTLESTAAPEIDALSSLTDLADQMAQMQNPEGQQAADGISDAAVSAIEAATRAIDGLTATQGGLQRSIAAQHISFMDPMGTGMATNNLPSSAEFSDAFNGRSAGLMGWISDALNKRTGVDEWIQNRSLSVADLLAQKIGADSEGSFTYRRSPDYNAFNEFNLEDEFRGVSAGLSDWIVRRLSERDVADETVQRNSQTVIDWLTRRLDIDPSGTLAGNAVQESFAPVMNPMGSFGSAMDETEWNVPLDMAPLESAIRDGLSGFTPPIMAASPGLSEPPVYREPQQSAAFMTPNGDGAAERRTLDITLNGQGAIKVDGAISADRAAEIASEQIASQAKDVLLGIIKQEMSEEGERSYVF